MFTELKCKIFTNFMLILFPLCFAVNVGYSLIQENAIINKSEQIEDETVCIDSIFLNMAFAVVLAAIWNGQKIMKIGAL
jgi:hypothetical protein